MLGGAWPGAHEAPLGSAVLCPLIGWKFHELAYFVIIDPTLLVCFPVCMLHLKSLLKDGNTVPSELPTVGKGWVSWPRQCHSGVFAV